MNTSKPTGAKPEAGNCECLIDIDSETLVSFSEGNRLPGLSFKPAYKTVYAWVNDGRRSQSSGEIHKLESIQVAGTRYTSVEAFRRWTTKLNEAKK